MLRSSLCTEAELMSEPFLVWADRMRPAWAPGTSPRPPNVHRKLWEWFFIAEALKERGLLEPGSRGLGFGVGQDPLASVFASLGCEVVATDLDVGRAAEAGWVETGQHAREVAQLNQAGLCDPDDFAKRVSFRTVDMNHVPPDLGDFDFTWSSCSFEHLGSIALGQEFILRQMRCLRPGGVAIHTTEYNVSSNRDTIAAGQTVLFRRRDIEWIAEHLRADNHIIDLDFDAGTSPADRHVDVPPWSSTHLKLRIDHYVATSIGLIIEKNPWAGAETGPPPLVRRARHQAALGYRRAAPRVDAGRAAVRRPAQDGAARAHAQLRRIRSRLNR